MRLIQGDTGSLDYSSCKCRHFSQISLAPTTEHSSLEKPQVQAGPPALQSLGAGRVGFRV